MRVIERGQGATKYFYLQHSYRKNGKVTTREVYLGKAIPDNIDERKAELMLKAKEGLNDKLEKIRLNFQKQWQSTPISAQQRELKEIAIAFTYNTNAIEGSTITLNEARIILEDQVAPNKPLKEIRETESHAATFLKMLQTQEKVTSDLILKWHLQVFKDSKPDIAGKYRTYHVRVGSYLAPNCEKVESLMNQLVSFLNESSLNPVELAARAHYTFEKIHPFGDGNGRVGRLLMNYILWRSGYPLLIIEYKKRKSYYKALERPEEGFVNYLTRRYLAVHRQLAV